MAATTTHPHLLAPGRIGPIRTRNRIVLPAMDQNSCTSDGRITDLTVAHYGERARGGAGLLTLETSAVAYPEGATSRHQPSVADDGCIPGLERLAGAVHAHGACMVVQICHHGKGSGVDAKEGREQLVPSVPIPQHAPDMVNLTMDELMRMAASTGGRVPTQREATAEDLERIVGRFADAAARVQTAGLDGIEVHAGHGYLLSTFLSPLYNRREDDYGGTPEKRARLLCEVVRAIRGRCGEGFGVIVRIDGREYADGGITPQLAATSAALAEAAGADAVHVSAMSPASLGWGFTDGPLPWLPNQYVELARAVKARVSVPVVAVGRILPDAAEALLADGVTCDFVSFGRQLLADPDLPNRLTAGRPDLVRPCINCFVCVAENFWDAKPVCVVNARLGHYDEPVPEPVSVRRHVVVVGGGPGGMEAARVAAGRGHRVTLLESGERLGGTARFSSLTTPINGELVRYLEAAILELGVDVRLGTRADIGTVQALAPDTVVVATGARRVRPEVPGADLPHVLSGDDLRNLMTGEDPTVGRGLSVPARVAVAAGRRLGLLRDMDRVRSLSRRWLPLSDTVAVLGGGLVGLELAEFLAERGRSVTLLEEGAHVGLEMAHPRRLRAVHEAEAHGVRIERGVRLVEITSDTVVVERDGENLPVPARSVLVASGVHPDGRLAEALVAAGLEVRVVGDAAEVGYIQGAIRSGHLAAREL